MTISLQAASKQAINLGKQLKNIIEIGEMLEELGNLSAYAEKVNGQVGRANEAKEQAVEELDTTMASLNSSRIALDIAKTKHASFANDAALERAIATKAAEAEADGIIHSAAHDAALMVQQAEKDLRVFVGERDTLLTEKAQLSDQITGFKDELASIKERLG